MDNGMMQTFTGKYVNPLDLKPDDIDIVDIAHHLSLICRFNGACMSFYSVAQHSLLVSDLMPNEDKLAALLHDAAEAYISDVTRPVKYSIPDIKKIEDRIIVKILAKYDCSGADWAAIKKADNVILATERRDLMVPTGTSMDIWNLEEKPLENIIIPWAPNLSESMFFMMITILIREQE